MYVPQWRDQAACLAHDPETWHPPERKHAIKWARDSDDALRAVTICCSCPVIEECTTYALEAHEPYGVWGGLMPHQLQAMRNAHRSLPPAPRYTREIKGESA